MFKIVGKAEKYFKKIIKRYFAGKICSCPIPFMRIIYEEKNIFVHLFFIVGNFSLNIQYWSCLDYVLVLVNAVLTTTPGIANRNIRYIFFFRPPSVTTGAGGVAMGTRAGEATPGVRFSGGIAGGSCAKSLQCTCKA